MALHLVPEMNLSQTEHQTFVVVEEVMIYRGQLEDDESNGLVMMLSSPQQDNSLFCGNPFGDSLLLND